MSFEPIDPEVFDLEDLSLRCLDAVNAVLTSYGFTTDPSKAVNMDIADALKTALTGNIGICAPSAPSAATPTTIPAPSVNYPYQALAIAMHWAWQQERWNTVNRGGEPVHMPTVMGAVKQFLKKALTNDPDPDELQPMRATLVIQNTNVGRVTLDFNQMRGSYSCPGFVSLDADGCPSDPRYTSWYRVDDMLTQVSRHLQAIDRSQKALRTLVNEINK